MNYRNFSLTKFASSSGCAAKLEPSAIDKNLANLIEPHPNLLSSITSNEDAGIFKINDEFALVQTLDFMTPLVDDPYIFGQIAAANALGDVFAMGGEAISAMNIVGFDNFHFSDEILVEILEGGKSKIAESGAVLVGGHTIKTPEIYYGLSVTGKVSPNNFWSNNTAQIGDVLILTKPLGTGIISTAIKADFLEFSEFKEALEQIKMLNLYATRVVRDLRIHAATDITGFGLLGHASEMINDSISFKFYADKIPFFENVQKCVDNGLIPAGSYKNLEFTKKNVNITPDIKFCDAQTNGGLLLSVSAKDADIAITRLKDAGYKYASIIAEVIKKDEFKIYI
ncbi:MAG: selenide, water dikinase SelD [Campylobacter sp.]|nr:selenide, water dikinase SelD [Campylobacter sp.]